MPRILIGLIGRKGSGKGTVAKLLKERYHASIYRMSDPLRDILERLALEPSRENLVQLSEVLRRGFGEQIIMQALRKQIEQDPHELIVIDGIRRQDELRDLDMLGIFRLVRIEAPLELRFERLRTRGENAGEAQRTFASFQEMEHAPTEITIGDIEHLAWKTIHNNGTPAELEHAVAEMMQELS